MVKRKPVAHKKVKPSSGDPLQDLTSSLARYERLFTSAENAGNLGAAMRIQREIIVLQEERRRLTKVNDPGAPSPEKEELERIRAHLIPLKLADESYPLHEHARIAADRLREKNEP